jgi:hypothetical protein
MAAGKNTKQLKDGEGWAGGWVFGKIVSLRTTSQLRWDVVKNVK